MTFTSVIVPEAAVAPALSLPPSLPPGPARPGSARLHPSSSLSYLRRCFRCGGACESVPRSVSKRVFLFCFPPLKGEAPAPPLCFGCKLQRCERCEFAVGVKVTVDGDQGDRWQVLFHKHPLCRVPATGSSFFYRASSFLQTGFNG